MTFSVMTLPLLPMPNIPGLERAEGTPKAGTLTKLYREIQAAGGEALDISSIDMQFGGEDAVQQALLDTGLRCSCYLAFIEAPCPTEDGQNRAIQQGKAAVDTALRLGTQIMMFVPAGNQAAVEVMTRQQLADQFIAVLGPVTAYARERGVTVVIEDAPHLDFPMCSEVELRYLLEGVPGLKLVYDSGNMCYAGEDPLDYYDHLREYVAHGHAKDVMFQDGAWRETVHGSGTVNFRELFRHMEQDGFEGVIAVELSPDFSGKQTTMDRVKAALDYLKGM